jgi:hypothetical protein
VGLYSAARWRLLQTLKVENPTNVLVDSSNGLYVGCCAAGHNAVEVFPPGSSTPALTITDGITSLQAMALGAP